MRLPTPLYRRKRGVHKNNFGHVLIIAGSNRMLGAAALCGLAASRSGAGLVTVGTPKSSNLVLQKKITNNIMTLPLPETSDQSISVAAWNKINKEIKKFSVIAVGPGLSQNPSTQKFIRKVITQSRLPLVIDADALNALSGHLKILKTSKTEKILTPHPGEMARLIRISKSSIEENREKVVKKFAGSYNCTVLLKGHNTLVYTPNKPLYRNKSGNAGMAKAGSGDVLTGIITALIAQGLSAHDAGKYGSYIHGKAGDMAARKKSKTSMISDDIINNLDPIFKK